MSLPLPKVPLKNWYGGWPLDLWNYLVALVGVLTATILPSAVQFLVRNVVTANIADLSAYTVAANPAVNDNVANVAGDVILLAAQTPTTTQNGPWVVGTVVGGFAPLTRPAWFAHGSSQPSGLALLVRAEGAVYRNTTWRAMVPVTNFLVDGADGEFYPEAVTFEAALVAGVVTAGAGATAGAPATAFIFSTKTMLIMTRLTGNTAALTVQYAYDGAPTPGTGATGSISGMATIASAGGTINVADISTMVVTYRNQAA